MAFQKQILITGASGFIGSYLVEKALELGYSTWAAIRSTSSKEYLQDARINFIDLNFGDRKQLTLQLQEFAAKHGTIDYVVHNAGVTKCLDPKTFDKVNFENTANLIDALKAANSIPSRFVLMSSLSVMGVGDEDNYTPITLDAIPQPNTAYGISKLKAEQYLQNQIDFPYIILRPTGVYGPREKDYYLMLKTVKYGLDIGAGFKAQHLTFIYVKDLVDVAFVSLNSTIANTTYFVADGDAHTDREYTQQVKNALEKTLVFRLKVPLWILKAISVVAEAMSKLTKKPSTLNRDKYKIMKQRNWKCDISALERELKFVAKYDLERGLKESIDWYKANGWL